MKRNSKFVAIIQINYNFYINFSFKLIKGYKYIQNRKGKSTQNCRPKKSESYQNKTDSYHVFLD